jgi:hypothetical protein
MRDWTFIDDKDPDDDSDGDESKEVDPHLALKREIREEMIKKLAVEWNDTHARIERESFRDRDDRDEEADFLGEMANEEGDQAFDAAEQAGKSKEECQAAQKKAIDAYYAEVDRKKSIPHARLEVIEELLGELGARMKRPYEHWNEDERYMEYMENRYENEDRDY